MAEQQRLYYIETFRGLACLLIVWFHVIEGLVARGDVNASIEAYTSFNSYIKFMRLPLFTFISGYVYALNPVLPSHWMIFLRKKAKRLLVPYLILSPIFFLLRAIMPTNRPPSLADILYIYTHPDLIFWYLPALMWICIALVPIELYGLLKNFKSGALCILAFTLILWVAHPVGGENSKWLLATAGAMQLFPFFLMGCWFYRFQDVLTGKYLCTRQKI